MNGVVFVLLYLSFVWGPVTGWSAPLPEVMREPVVRWGEWR